jgi:hypothetical protein
VVWWTNNTAAANNSNSNDELMFRASNDGGATFEDKINLNNIINTGPTKAETDLEAISVIVPWWETNQTSDVPVIMEAMTRGERLDPHSDAGKQWR